MVDQYKDSSAESLLFLPLGLSVFLSISRHALAKKKNDIRHC